jgi:hypothetical protein
MAVFIHPYRPEIIERLRAVAETKIDEMKATRGMQQLRETAGAADADALIEKVFPADKVESINNPEFCYSISVDLIPICRRATDIRFFDLIDDAVNGSTNEVSVSMHFNKNKQAEKHILRFSGVNKSGEFKNMQTIDGFVPASEVDKIKSQTADQVRREIEADIQKQENQMLREQIEKIQNAPPPADSGFNKLILTAGMAAIKKWEHGDFEKRDGKPQITKEQAFTMGLGKKLLTNFNTREELDLLLDILQALSERKYLLPTLREMIAGEPTGEQFEKMRRQKQNPNNNQHQPETEPPIEESNEEESDDDSTEQLFDTDLGLDETENLLM